MKSTDATERPTELHNPLYIDPNQCRGGYSLSLYSLALSQASKGLHNRYSPASRYSPLPGKIPPTLRYSPASLTPYPLAKDTPY